MSLYEYVTCILSLYQCAIVCSKFLHRYCDPVQR